MENAEEEGKGMLLKVPEKMKEEENLSFYTKVLYGFPVYGQAGMAMLLIGILPKYYTDSLKVSLSFISIMQFVAGTVTTIGVLFVGWLSDQLNWKYGRRRPILLIFSPVAAIGFTLIFFPVDSVSKSPSAMQIWFGVLFFVYTCGASIARLAAASLRIELTQRDDQRIALFTYTGMIAGLGVLVASVIAMVAPNSLGSDEAAINFAGVFFGVFFLFAAVALAILAKENPAFWREPIPLVPAIRRCVENGPWIRYLISGIVNSTMTSIIGLRVFVYDYSLKVDPLFWFGVASFLYSILSFFLTPMWYTIINKYNIDKVTAFKATQVVLIVHGAVAFVGALYSIYVALIGSALLAIWASGHIIIDSAMLGDCVDYDELRSGKRREGTYVSVTSLPNIFFDVLTKSVPLLVIHSLGYDNTLDDQSDVVVFALCAFVGVTPMVCGLLALIVIWYYPITGTMHKQIVDNIEILRDGGSAFDPLTGEIMQWTKTDQDRNERYVGELDMDWIADYFSQHELVLFASASPDAALSRVWWELVFSCSMWLLSAILTAWQAVVLLLAENSEMAFFAIAVTSFLMFMFIFDLARLPIVAKIIRQGKDTSYIVDRILEKYVNDHFVKLKTQDGSMLDGVAGESVLSSALVATDSRNASTWHCSDILAFVGWRMIAYIPVLVLFLGGNFGWF